MGRIAGSFGRNLQYSVRVLRRSPGFTVTVLITFALSIGANSAVFSGIDAILLRPLPYVEPDRLVAVMETRPEAGATPIAPVRLEEWNAGTSTLEAISGYFVEDVSENSGEASRRVRRAGVAPKFLNVWRVAPLMGRGFTDADHAERPSIIMISERLWRDRFAAAPDILDRTLRLGETDGGSPFAIVGVLPESFRFPERDVDVWFPNFTNFEQGRNRNTRSYLGVGRLRPGVTIDEARADMKVVQARLADEFPDSDADIGISLRPLKEVVVGETRVSLWLAFAAVSLLLLIACANVAALLLARANAREHEVAVRRSLGASVGVIAAQTLTEAGILAVAGAAAGLLLAAGTAAAFRLLAPDLPRLDEIGLDLRITAYTATSAVVVALLCGLAPAVRSAHGAESLRSSGRTQVAGHQRVQWTLVGVQVAFSVTLLVGAGLLLRSFDALSRVDPGFEPERVLGFRVSGSNFEYVNTDVPARVERTRAGLEEIPGVEAAAVAFQPPGVTARNSVEFRLAGSEAAESEMVADFRIVSPSYFTTLGIPLLAGELCRVGDDRTAYAMVNRSFATRYFPTGSVIDLELAGNPARRVVGIVGDAREAGIATAPLPAVYLCVVTPSATPWYFVRTAGAPPAAAAAVRAKLRDLEPSRAVYELAPLTAHIGDSHTERRLRTLLLTAFAATALALTCLGIYGTLSYVVGLRRREVGLRVALGAMASNIVTQFLLRALRVVAIAAIVGVGLSVAFGRVLSGMLFGISPFDPFTLLGAIAIVVLVAGLASLVPAVRAARVEPMSALRDE
jgi:putative ABC transport system permease protein